MSNVIDAIFEFITPRYRHILLCIMLAVVIPTTLWGIFLDSVYLSGDANFSIMSSVFSVLFSFFLIYQFRQHPNIELPFYIIFAHSISLIIVIFLVFMFRFQYSIIIIMSGYLISILYSILIIPIIGQHGRISYAIVPGGHVKQLVQSGLISFRVLHKPDSAIPRSEHIVADLDFKHAPEWDKFLADCALSDHEVHSYKFVQEQASGRMTIDRLSENAMGTLLPSKTYLAMKLLVDYVICLIVFIPVMVIIGIACVVLLFTEGGPALFKQQRVGFRGKAFTAYKLRTMRNVVGPDLAGDSARNSAMTLENDPRITRLGAILRKYRIDELPQIFNILRGEMSWIGPRPEAVPLHDYYAEELPFYRYRSVVRPGITGWAQVMQGHVTSVDEVLDKLKYDFYYIKYLSFSLDIIIVLKTVRTVILGSGAK